MNENFQNNEKQFDNINSRDYSGCQPGNPQGDPNIQQGSLQGGPYMQQGYPQGGLYAFQVPPQATPYQTRAVREETVQEGILRKKFPFFGITSAIYAIFYTICLYKNMSGITSPFFAAGTLFYLYFCFKKLGVPFKKETIFYIGAILLLGISMFLTADGRIIWMNYVGIFLLLVSLLLHSFYKDEGWGLSKYFSAMGMFLLEWVGAIGQPFRLFSVYLRSRGERKQNSKWKHIFTGLVISIPLLLIIMWLLTSADRIFRDFIDRSTAMIVMPRNIVGIILLILFAFFASFCSLAALSRRDIPQEPEDKRKQEPLIAITVTVLLCLIYLLFCGVQIGGLFLGAMQLPEGYTYAYYAREGFFQLLIVCVMNFFIVLICLGYFKRHKVLQITLTVISFCTYIMIASSALRMILYINAYHLTFLRIFVLWALAVISLSMAGVVITIYWEKFPLFRYIMIGLTVFYLGLSFSHPDYWIAKYNVNAIEQEWNNAEIINTFQFSADAAPILAKHQEKTEYYKYYEERVVEMYQEMNLRSFNVSRYLAGKAVQSSKRNRVNEYYSGGKTNVSGSPGQGYGTKEAANGNRHS